MSNKIMFVIGCIVVLIYFYFLFSIIRKQNKVQKRELMNEYDTRDLDGMGNQGRIPS
ncbi:MAG: hypothetical protein ACO3LB_08890 [Flavobacteriaceae bacterium]